jgi:hypothetical protein
VAERSSDRMNKILNFLKTIKESSINVEFYRSEKKLSRSIIYSLILLMVTNFLIVIPWENENFSKGPFLAIINLIIKLGIISLGYLLRIYGQYILAMSVIGFFFIRGKRNFFPVLALSLYSWTPFFIFRFGGQAIRYHIYDYNISYAVYIGTIWTVIVFGLAIKKIYTEDVA